MNIRTLGGGRYQLIWELQPDEYGRRQRRTKSVKCSYTRATELWRAGQVELDKGSLPLPANMKFAELADRWMRDVARVNCRESTIYSYEIQLRTHLLPDLGHLTLEDLKPALLASYFARKLKTGRADGRGGLSTRSVRYLHSLVTEILGQAVTWGLSPQNAAQRVKKVKLKQKERPVWDEAQLGAFLSVAQRHPLYPLFALAFSTGMREGELLGLPWRDIDLEAGMLRVSQTIIRTSEGRKKGEPKTEQGKRTIALSEEMVALLRQHRAAQLKARLKRGEYEDNGLVFATRTGKPIGARNLLRLWGQLCDKAGVPRIPPHSARHMVAAYLFSLGKNPKMVQEMLGHFDPGFTIRVYGGHAAQKEQRDAAKDLGGRVFRKG